MLPTSPGSPGSMSRPAPLLRGHDGEPAHEGAVPLPVGLLLRPGSPTEVLQPVVRGVAVEVAAAVLVRGARADEGEQDQLMDAVVGADVAPVQDDAGVA